MNATAPNLLRSMLMPLGSISEFYGRRPVYLVSWGIFTIFQIPVSSSGAQDGLSTLNSTRQLAVAPNIATVLVCRFIQGFSGS